MCALAIQFYNTNNAANDNFAHAANNLNQVASVPGRSAMTWSDAGNLNNDGKGTNYVHNGLQKLIKATKADGTTYDFRYDGDGLMVEAVKNATGINDVFQFIGGLKTRYVTSATEEVAELDGNRVVTKRFIAGPAIDERIAQIDANNAVKYIHGDKQNSVIALTNATGNPILRRAYGEYGETDVTQMAQEGHPFGYTGRRWFTDLGLYYYRARWYDPELGTFLETDPIGSLDYINLYSYVGLNPLNATDPTGMESGSVAYKGAVMLTAAARESGYPPHAGAITGVVYGGLFCVVACPAAYSYYILNAPQIAMIGELVITGYTPAGASVLTIGAVATKAGVNISQMSSIIKAQGNELKGVTKLIAESGKVKDAPRLVAKYGGEIKDWVKIKSSNQKFKNGVNVETHAYKNTETGQVVEPKLKIHEPQPPK